jgi:hypothetical protein
MQARVIAWTGHRPDLFLDPEVRLPASSRVGEATGRGL